MWLCLTVRTLPIQVSDLSPAWLSGVLGLEVVDVTVLDHASATNQRVRLGLTYATAGEGPTSLFVKLASPDPAHREMIGASAMGEREARFYVDVAPSVDLRVPRSYYAASADDGVSPCSSRTLPPAGARLGRRLGRDGRRGRRRLGGAGTFSRPIR